MSLSSMEQTIALAAEYLDVDVKTVATGTVTVATKVVETDEMVTLPLQHVAVEIDRISINRAVDHTVPTREEGDVTIVSVYEEVLVVTKQLVLKEELHIRRRSSMQPAEPQTFKLRREEITVTRSGAGSAD